MSDETETTEIEATEAEEAPPPAKKPAKTEPKPSDSEAKLLKEVMALKKKLATADEAAKRFEGIDPDAVRTLLDKQAAADEAARQAEEQRLVAAGDFEKLKKSMADEHKRQLDAERAARAAEQGRMAALQHTIDELTVGQAFAGSAFLREETLLTPAKARKIYAGHFDTDGGKLLAYDRERGAEGREPLVTASGEPLGFDEAMKRIIEADPERDQLMRGKSRGGSGQTPAGGRAPAQKKGDDVKAGVPRILAGLAGLKPEK